MWSNEIDAVDAKKEFVKFLEEYDEEHACEFSAESGRHTIDLDKLRKYCDNKDKKDLITKILDEPATYLTSLASAVEEFESQRNTGLKGVSKQSEVKICLKGNFGSRSISPRDLLSHYIEKIVSVKGIVTKCTAVRPKLTKITQFCSETNKFSHRTYRDATTLRGAPTSLAISARDETGNQLTTEYGLSSYSDQQCITIQEMPEHSPSGQLPRSVEVVLEDDLVDTCKPGDRVNIVGVYKVLPSRLPNMALGGTFRTLLVAIGITQLSGEISVPDLTSTDHAMITKLAKRDPEDLLKLLGQSLAPSIFGHDTIKRALILLLIGGIEKNLQNGTHIRGDVNCLMVGDPSVAKSQLLRCVMGVAPFAISTTGRGSSGVGLTAAVSTDQDTGERRLEAGAMVLADRGVVCIDEFDKMNDADRVAIHEVMEQQTVTIAKAGIHASLNARCSVLAAANPIYGTYDHSQPVPRNINLPDSLLSRFDLLFVVLDEASTVNDRQISSHVLSMHARDEHHGLETDHDQRKLLSCSSIEGGEDDVRLLNKTFLKKFIFYVKRRPRAELTADAERCLAEHYSSWRNEKSGTQHEIPITARTLETMIRLSTAHAKMRLSTTVERGDALVALEIMRSVMETDTKNVAAQGAVVSNHYDCFTKELAKLTERCETIAMTTLEEMVNTWEGCENLSRTAMLIFLHKLQDAGKVLIDDDQKIHRL